MRVFVALMLLQTVALAAGPPPLAAPPFRSYAVEPVAAHPEWDVEYTEAIRANSTGTQFMTDLVDHLPASATVPSPLRFLGKIAGVEGRLTYATDIHRYLRALAAASPRVRVFTLGSSEEGREMVLVAIADEVTIAHLDETRAVTGALADPRSVTEGRARELITQGKPIYYLTGGLHSPESGAPEMLMELAYRLAVEDTPLVRGIRENVITLITPVLEVDGHERWVDLTRWHDAHPDSPLPPFVYWGHYVAHDNNRDTIGLALALTRNVQKAVADWHPQVMHDLHESVPFLYISSGTGPYNAWLDPLVIGEWERMAYREVQALTAKGLPGVWTHGFFDGWAPGYLFWLALGRNAVGRFYETFGNALPDTEERVVRGMSERTWYRPNPPLPEVRWSLRDNVNFQQSGVLLALSSVAADRERVLEQFWQLGKRSVAKATTEGPAAYVFPADQLRRGQLRDLMSLLQRHGIEVHVTDRVCTVRVSWPPASRVTEPGRSGEGSGTGSVAAKQVPESSQVTFPAGSFVVRLDQPLSRLADALLDTQYVRGDERLYDDAGWTVGIARNLAFTRVVDPEILSVPVHLWERSTRRAEPLDANAVALAISNCADTDLVRFRAALPDLEILAAEEGFEASKRNFPAGTAIVPVDAARRAAISEALSGLDLTTTALSALPQVTLHQTRLPRLAVLHTWSSTQDEGWFRLAFEELGLPYEYISTQDVSRLGELRARYDVIIFPPVGRGRPQDLVNGYPPGPPLPWKRSELTPNLGVDETEDVRPGLGLLGVEALYRFVTDGGLLIAVGDAAAFAVHFGLARYVQVVETSKVKVTGSLLKAVVADRGSPVAWGYDEAVPVYFDAGLVFRVGVFPERDGRETRPSGRGGVNDPDVPQGRPFIAAPERPQLGPGEEGFELPESHQFFYRLSLPAAEARPRIILTFPKSADEILLSGQLEGGGELAGRPLVVDCPLGTGHVLLFGNNPMWRHNTQGSWALITNAILNHTYLSLGWPSVAKNAGTS